MNRSLIAGVLALGVAVGCSAAPVGPQPTGSNSSAIQGGTDDTTHTFAVGLVVLPSATMVAFCSGALIAPKLVATARHCAAAISSSMVDCSSATFGSDYNAGDLLVTTDATITMESNFVTVAQVVTPPATAVCGDDLALLILSSNIQLPQYVTPVLSPPITDHSVYSEQITAIGYGIDDPTDTMGTSAGTRRIRQNIPISCIPNDPTFDCYPQFQGIVASNEFQAADGTCEGDSGSGAYDEESFDQGVWKSFGVLSRGTTSTDGKTCIDAVYTRFDSYSQLLIDTANTAAKMGGYTPPAWTSGTPTLASSASADAGGISLALGGGNGAMCTSNGDCTSNNCVTADDGGTYFCASSCNASSDCPTGFNCEDGFCISPSATSTGTTGGSSGGKGCSVTGAGGPTEPVPWRSLAAGLGVLAVLGRRRSGARGRGR